MLAFGRTLLIYVVEIEVEIEIGMETGLSPGDFVLDGDPASSPKRGLRPQFSAHFYCGQTAGCINMPLGMEVGLSPGDFV